MSDEKKPQDPTPEPPKKKEHWWKRLGKKVEQDAGNAIGEAMDQR